MADMSQIRGWPIYFDETVSKWRFCDTGEISEDTWFNRPCGHCGLYGSSNEGQVDPCLGVLAGVTNACCGHGNPEHAYICFMGGFVVRGFDVECFHHRKLSDEEQDMITEHNEARRRFRTLPGS